MKLVGLKANVLYYNFGEKRRNDTFSKITLLACLGEENLFNSRPIIFGNAFQINILMTSEKFVIGGFQESSCQNSFLEFRTLIVAERGQQSERIH